MSPPSQNPFGKLSDTLGVLQMGNTRPQVKMLSMENADLFAGRATLAGPLVGRRGGSVARVLVPRPVSIASVQKGAAFLWQCK